MLSLVALPGSHSLGFRVKEPSGAYDGAPDNTSLDPTNDLDRQEPWRVVCACVLMCVCVCVCVQSGLQIPCEIRVDGRGVMETAGDHHVDLRGLGKEGEKICRYYRGPGNKRCKLSPQ